MAFQQPPPPQQPPVMEHQREPCPDRIIDDIGGAFAMGAVGGGVWNLFKGLKNSPSGYRVKGALEYLRKKEDPWNAIFAGAATGGFLQLRFGLRQAAKSAAFGGFLLAMIEGLGIALNKVMSPPPPGVPYQGPPPGMAPAGAGAGAPFPGMPMAPGAEASTSAAPPAAANSSAGSSSSWDLFSFFGGSENKLQATTVETQTFSDDAFASPPIPKEFQSDYK